MNPAIREQILEACHRLGTPAFRFNQGAWYVGRNAFEILIESISHVGEYTARQRYRLPTDSRQFLKYGNRF